MSSRPETYATHPDLDVLQHGLTLWDLDREFATGGFGGRPLMKLREILGVLRDSYTLTVGIDGDKVTLTDATGATVNVVDTDIEASNGVIHVIDGVAMPSA